MKIANNTHFYKTREKPEKQSKYERQTGARHLTKEKTKKLYDYYICDYCKEEIKVTKKWEDKTGGVVKLPKTLTGLDYEICLVLCNKCLNHVINEFEERKEELENKTNNHICCIRRNK